MGHLGLASPDCRSVMLSICWADRSLDHCSGKRRVCKENVKKSGNLVDCASDDPVSKKNKMNLPCVDDDDWPEK